MLLKLVLATERNSHLDTNGNEKTESAQESSFDKGEKSSSKKKRFSKNALFGIAIGGVVLIILCAVFLPRVLLTPESLIKQGKYEEAYEVADESEKREIAIGNIIAWCSAEVYESLFDTLSKPDSFELIDAYYDGKIDFVLHASFRARGALGVKSDAYFYFNYRADGDISLFTAFSDLNEEETYSESASEDEKLKALVKNWAIDSAREVVENPSYKVNGIFIDEVNTLIKNGELLSVELIPQAKEVIESNKNAQ